MPIPNSLLSAAQQAIRIHDLQKHSSDLGPMIVVWELDKNNTVVDEVFIQTSSLTQTCVNGPYQEDGERVKAILAELEEELERNGYDY